MPSSASICLRAVDPTSSQPLTPRPDHDRLLAVPLDVQGRVHVKSGRSAGRSSRGSISSTTTAMRVRQLVPYALQRGLADQLADHDLVRLVGELAVGVERGPSGSSPTAGRPAARPGRRATAETGTTSAHSKPSRSASAATASSCSPTAGAVDPVGLGDDGDLRRCPGRPRARAAMNRSPGPTGSSAGRQKPDDVDLGPGLRGPRRSAARRAGSAACAGPGCRRARAGASGRCTMPRTGCRVVCGWFDVIATFSPTSAFVSVDLPALGRPTRAGEARAVGRARRCHPLILPYGRRSDRRRPRRPVLRARGQDGNAGAAAGRAEPRAGPAARQSLHGQPRHDERAADPAGGTEALAQHDHAEQRRDHRLGEHQRGHRTRRQVP